MRTSKYNITEAKKFFTKADGIKKIDRIVNVVKKRIAEGGYYENAGMDELRSFMDTIGFEDYSLRCYLQSYFNQKLDQL